MLRPPPEPTTQLNLQLTTHPSPNFGVDPLDYPNRSGRDERNERGLTVTSFSQSKWWAELDSNQRRRKPADLQSAPFGHFGIYPLLRGTSNLRGALTSGKRVLQTFNAPFQHPQLKNLRNHDLTAEAAPADRTDQYTSTGERLPSSGLRWSAASTPRVSIRN